MNGKQPLSKLDFFVLWHQRMMATTLIQSGKSLREEFHALSFNERVQSQADVTNSEYVQNMQDKKIAVLTRNFSLSNLEDNNIYKTDIGEKIIYAAQSDLTSE